MDIGNTTRDGLPRRAWQAAVVALPLATVLGIAAAATSIAAPPTPKSKAAKSVTSQPKKAASTAPLTEEQRITHLLSRIGFGPRPGDVQRVKEMGISRYLDLQLHPERTDDSALDSRLVEAFPALQQSGPELARAYFDGLQMAKEIKRLQTQVELNTTKSGAGDDAMMEKAGGITQGAPGAGAYAEMMQNATPEQREELRRLLEERRKTGGKKGVAAGAQQLQADKVFRAVESQDQLQEVLVDFWSNHFNIDIRKGQCRVFKVADEREVIRKHALGKFRDLLEASAKSPAMLFYLDNVQSRAPLKLNPRQEARLRRAAAQGMPVAKAVQQRSRGGVNENYARELMELHTLGVDGGYTQKDVTEVARCLTGWGISGNQSVRPGEFAFNLRAHDSDEKTVLGQSIPAGGGIEDGEKVLDILASHPSTMRFISTKLCQRLVSDEPSKTLVDKCVTTWKRTDGDIREIVRTIVTSPEFNSRTAYRQKIKSPFEYAVSAVRALDGHIRLPGEGAGRARLAALPGGGGGGLNGVTQRMVSGQVGVMGQPLFQCQPPTGYSEDSRKWVSSGALIARLNFALGLTNGNLLDVDLSRAQEMLADGERNPISLVEHLEDQVIQTDLSPATRATLLKQAAVTEDDGTGAGVEGTRRLVALVLGSPEFQRK